VDGGGKSAGRHPVSLHEGASHMTLIGKAACCCRLGKRHADADEAPCDVDPPLDLIGMRRETGLSYKGPKELKLAEAGFLRQFAEGYRARRIVVQQSCCPPDSGTLRRDCCRAWLQHGGDERHKFCFALEKRPVFCRRGGKELSKAPREAGVPG